MSEHFAISNSRIEAYESCPYYFFREYVNGPKRDYSQTYDPHKPLPLRIGQFCHRVSELYTKALIETRQREDYETFRAVFNDEWQQHHHIPASEYQTIFDFLHSWAEKHSIDPDTTLAAELEIALTWDLKMCNWESKEAWVRMKLDRVDVIGDMGIIEDYKTQYYVPSDTEIKKSLQGKIYPWGLAILNDYLTQFEVRFSYMRWGIVRPSEPYVLQRSDLDLIEQQLRTFTRKIEEKISVSPEGEDPQYLMESVWPATLGVKCAICPYDCPLATRGETPVKTLWQAIDVGMQIQALKEKQRKLKERLKEWSGTYGAIDIGVGVYDQIPTTTIKLKASTLAQYCLDEGISLDNWLKTDTDKIRKCEDPELQTKILSLARVIGGVKFSYKQTKKIKETKAVEEEGEE